MANPQVLESDHDRLVMQAHAAEMLAILRTLDGKTEFSHTEPHMMVSCPLLTDWQRCRRLLREMFREMGQGAHDRHDFTAQEMRKYL